MVLPALTERQSEVLRFIASSIIERRFPPTVREICNGVGLTSPSSVHYQLDSLSKKGYILREDRSSRAIGLTEQALSHPIILAIKSSQENTVVTPSYPAESSPVISMFNDVETGVQASDYVNVPVVGSIAAGNPILATQAVDDVFPLPRQLTGEGDLFTLHVKGDSMIDAAICDGDWVVVRSQPVANNGEIVAAMIDGDATVKVFQHKNGHVTLLPCNENYDPIPADGAQLLGKVVMVMRSL